MAGYALIRASVVLVVAESQYIRKALCRYVETLLPDWAVIGAEADGDVADVMRSRLPDVILIDVALPCTDGVGAVRRLRTLSQSAVIVPLVIDDDAPYLESLCAAGATTCLHIWELREKLLATLENALRPLGATVQRRTVVCVEDDLDMFDLIRFCLERHDFTVVGAIGGRNAMEVIRRHKPDVVLLDLMMPDVSGWDVLREMEADPKTMDVPVVLVTVLDTKWPELLGPEVKRPYSYLRKPFSPHDLLSVLDTILAKSDVATS